MTTVVSDLQAVLKLDVRKDESAEDFVKRLARKANDMTEDKWEGLEEKSQHWVNDAVEALNKRRPVPVPEGIEELFEAGSEETGDPVDDQPGEEEEETVPKKAKKKVAAKAVAPKKKVAAKKAAAVGRKGNFATTGVIKILVKENPFRDGTKGSEWFAKYSSGMSVAEAIEAGVPRSQIRWDVRNQNISVS